MLTGTCHCGAAHWTLEGDPGSVTACNCTLCRRYGTLWAYDYVDERIRLAGPLSAYARAEGAGSVDGCFGKSTAALQKRVHAVEQILGALAQLPAPQPPNNLVAKTLKFIKKHEHDVTIAPAGRGATVTPSPTPGRSRAC